MNNDGDYEQYYAMPDWVKKIAKESTISLGSLDDYVDQFELYNSFKERYNEISEELYELCEEQILVENDFPHVWGVPTEFEKYISSNGIYSRLYATANMVRYRLDSTAKSKNLNIKNFPDIPIMEYVLIPTGNVQTYHPSADRDEQKREMNRVRWKEWDWAKRIYSKQKEKYKERRNVYDEEQRSEADSGDRQENDGRKSED